jgi:hypothetical protein
MQRLEYNALILPPLLQQVWVVMSLWCHHVQCTRVPSGATYQTLRLDGTQEVHVHSDAHVERPRLVPWQLPSVVPAGRDQGVQKLGTELAGVAEVRAGPAHKHRVSVCHSWRV